MAMDDFNILKLTEEDIKFQFITPAITGAGWKNQQIRMEYQFTDGRVIFQGSMHARQSAKKADYLLFAAPNQPIAVVEAKKADFPLGTGMQQALKYAEMLDVPFAYSSNGYAFLEHDRITGQEHEIKLEEFPSPEDLTKRWLDAKNLTDEQLAIVKQPYYFDRYTHVPRYYQRIAINRTVEAIAKGQNRILIVMATGTGKTVTAFQIIHRLMASGTKKKILYLADRNILIDQTMTQDFKPFKKVMTKVQGAKIDSAYEVFMALYHQLVSNDESVPDPFTQVDPNFFDLIIVDECHRGSAKDDSTWRKVLEYFSSATQIGMTATPKADYGANNIDYFGKAIYTYSLRQGIMDGFLAPYRVTRSFINIDLEGFVPEDDELDLLGRPIDKKYYQRSDFGRNIAFKLRRQIVARRITKMLHQIGRMTKTIVFCSDIEEAEAMRQLLVNLNSDLIKKDSRYVMRITGDDLVGKKQLDNFIDVDQPYPTVVTTSELLATGVDCKTCGLIVIDKEIASMSEFKQIVGRGTRLRPDKDKWHLEILDFRNATIKFSDPEFDSDPEPLTHRGPQKPSGKGEGGEEGGGEEGGDEGTVHEPQHIKYIVGGQDINIVGEMVSVLDTDGKTMRTESLTDFTRKQIRNRYATLNDFIKNWSEADRKKAIVDELKDCNVLIDAVREENPKLADADIFDIICHVAYDQPPLTRRERANNVRKRNYFGKYKDEARAVLEALLDKYADNGILDIEHENILDNVPFNEFGKPQKIIKLFGGFSEFEKALKELEKEIYTSIA